MTPVYDHNGTLLGQLRVTLTEPNYNLYMQYSIFSGYFFKDQFDIDKGSYLNLPFVKQYNDELRQNIIDEINSGTDSFLINPIGIMTKTLTLEIKRDKKLGFSFHARCGDEEWVKLRLSFENDERLQLVKVGIKSVNPDPQTQAKSGEPDIGSL